VRKLLTVLPVADTGKVSRAAAPRFGYNYEPECITLSRDLPELPARQPKEVLPAVQDRPALPHHVLVVVAQPAASRAAAIEDGRAFPGAEVPAEAALLGRRVEIAALLRELRRADPRVVLQREEEALGAVMGEVALPPRWIEAPFSFSAITTIFESPSAAR
jgi:hypothetical protein